MSRQEVEKSLAIWRKTERSMIAAFSVGLGALVLEGIVAYKNPDARVLLTIVGIPTIAATTHDGLHSISAGRTAATISGVLAQDALNQVPVVETETLDQTQTTTPGN